jgi:hypothetical protein
LDESGEVVLMPRRALTAKEIRRFRILMYVEEMQVLTHLLGDCLANTRLATARFADEKDRLVILDTDCDERIQSFHCLGPDNAASCGRKLGDQP